MIEEPMSYTEEREVADLLDGHHCLRCEEMIADCECPEHCDGCGNMVARGADCKCSARDEHDEEAGF